MRRFISIASSRFKAVTAPLGRFLQSAIVGGSPKGCQTLDVWLKPGIGLVVTSALISENTRFLKHDVLPANFRR